MTHRRLALFSPLLVAVLAALTTSQASAVEDATEPVGFYSINAKQGVNIFVPGLVAPEEFTGTIDGFLPGPGESVFLLSQAGFTAGAFDESPSFPTHFVEILDTGHPARGLVIDIIENGSGSLTLAIDGPTLAAHGITGTERIRVRRHVTLKTYFENTAIAPFSDEVKLTRPGGTLRYIHNGVNWVHSGTFAVSNDQVIYPGEGFSFRTSAASKNIVVGGNAIGYVKTTPTLVNVYGNGETNYIGQVNPLVGRNGSVGAMGFSNALTTAFADSVKLLMNSGNGNGLEATARYIFNGIQLVDAATFQPASADPVPYGYALWIRTRDDVAILLPPGF